MEPQEDQFYKSRVKGNTMSRINWQELYDKLRLIPSIRWQFTEHEARVAYLRGSVGMSVTATALRMGISQQHVRKLERSAAEKIHNAK